MTIAEWADLGRRLRELNPETWEKVLDRMRKIMECEEALAGIDGGLVVRRGRYSA